MTAWGACSPYIVNTACSRGLRWMLCCRDLLKILSRVWFHHKFMFRYHHYYVVSLFCWNLSLILVSLLNMLVLKCLILRVFASLIENSKEWREDKMYATKSSVCVCVYIFSHWISFYKMSVTKWNAPLRYCFVLDHAPHSIETCQLEVHAVGLSSKEYIGKHSGSLLLILYDGINW